MNKFIYVLTLIIFSCSLAVAQLTSVAGGKVKGTIYDQGREAVIPNLKVTIEGEGIKQTVVPDSETGEYEFNVPAGIYNITTEQSWTHPVKRASFRVEAGKNTTINLYPAIRITSIALTLGGDIASYGSIPKYDSLNIEDVSSDLIVQFLEQKSSSKIIKYKYVTMSFGSFTVLAKEISFNKKLKTIEVNGDVLLDDNGQRTKTKKAKIQFENGIAKVISIK